MANKTNISVVRRISKKLDDLLNGISQKNKIKFTEAGDIIVGITEKRIHNRKVIENIRREIEF